jgi:hypothetical protein
MPTLFYVGKFRLQQVASDLRINLIADQLLYNPSIQAPNGANTPSKMC